MTIGVTLVVSLPWLPSWCGGRGGPGGSVVDNASRPPQRWGRGWPGERGVVVACLSVVGRLEKLLSGRQGVEAASVMGERWWVVVCLILVRRRSLMGRLEKLVHHLSQRTLSPSCTRSMPRSALSPPQSEDMSPLPSTIDKLSSLGLTTFRVWSPAWTRRSWQRFACNTFPHCDAKEAATLVSLAYPHTYRSPLVLPPVIIVHWKGIAPLREALIWLECSGFFLSTHHLDPSGESSQVPAVQPSFFLYTVVLGSQDHTEARRGCHADHIEAEAPPRIDNQCVVSSPRLALGGPGRASREGPGPGRASCEGLDRQGEC